MSNYTKFTNFASKDSLVSGDPLKRIKGQEIDDEFNSIETVSATKANTDDAVLTGVPVAPTAIPSTSTTQLATTEFVKSSPVFIGVPEAPTAVVGTNTTQLATTEFVQAATPTAAVINALVYPVHSIFTTTNSYTASTLAAQMGVGVWVAFGAGRVLMGAGAVTDDQPVTQTFTAGDSGGEISHTTTVAEMPSHNHTLNHATGSGGAGGPQYTVGASTTVRSSGINDTGGSGAHNNLQPYIVVYFWRRDS